MQSPRAVPGGKSSSLSSTADAPVKAEPAHEHRERRRVVATADDDFSVLRDRAFDAARELGLLGQDASRDQYGLRVAGTKTFLPLKSPAATRLAMRDLSAVVAAAYGGDAWGEADHGRVAPLELVPVASAPGPSRLEALRLGLVLRKFALEKDGVGSSTLIEGDVPFCCGVAAALGAFVASGALGSVPVAYVAARGAEDRPSRLAPWVTVARQLVRAKARRLEQEPRALLRDLVGPDDASKLEGRVLSIEGNVDDPSALTRLLGALAPAVIVVDRAQHLDAASWTVAAGLRGAPLMAVYALDAPTRDGVCAPAPAVPRSLAAYDAFLRTAKPSCLKLDVLPNADLVELIMKGLGDNVASVSEALPACVFKLSQGVPFVAQAVIGALEKSNDLVAYVDLAPGGDGRPVSVRPTGAAEVHALLRSEAAGFLAARRRLGHRDTEYPEEAEVPRGHVFADVMKRVEERPPIAATKPLMAKLNQCDNVEIMCLKVASQVPARGRAATAPSRDAFVSKLRRRSRPALTKARRGRGVAATRLSGISNVATSPRRVSTEYPTSRPRPAPRYPANVPSRRTFGDVRTARAERSAPRARRRTRASRSPRSRTRTPCSTTWTLRRPKTRSRGGTPRSCRRNNRASKPGSPTWSERGCSWRTTTTRTRTTTRRRATKSRTAA